MTKGRILLLNGPSSAGKTTLAWELQTKAPNYWYWLPLDCYLDAVPSQQWETDEDEGFRTAFDLHHDCAKLISDQGKDVIVDTVICGRDYILRYDEKVIKSIDKKLEEDVKQGDRYFSYGKLNIYRTAMNYILDKQIWQSPINLTNIYMGITEMNFNLAFQKSWNEFYKEYWNDTLNEKKKLFEECINAFNFVESLEKMVFATHNKFTKDFYVFPAEALVYSALKFNDNVCMGALFVGDDIGFVHEGLHLLLQEEWASNGKIIEIIKKSDYKEKYYSSWVSKYEQALVVGLDCCIRNKNDTAEKYHKDCHVDDVFPISYPLIEEYYYNGCNEDIETLMLKIISRTV